MIPPVKAVGAYGDISLSGQGSWCVLSLCGEIPLVAAPNPTAFHLHPTWRNYTSDL